jgi:hypothetical protein
MFIFDDFNRFWISQKNILTFGEDCIWLSQTILDTLILFREVISALQPEFQPTIRPV